MMFWLALVTCFLYLPQEDEVMQEEGMTAQSVINRFIEAKGGEEKLRKIRNYIIEGRVRFDEQIEYQFKIYQATGQHLTVLTLPDGSTLRSGLKDSIAWRIDGDGNGTVLEGAAAEEFRRQNETVHEALEWGGQDTEIDYVGTVDRGFGTVRQLRFRTANGSVIDRYFDAESGLLVREAHSGVREGEEPVVVRMGDYRPTDDGCLVSRYRLVDVGGGTVEYRVDNVRSNAIDDDSVFAIPDEIKPLLADQHK